MKLRFLLATLVAGVMAGACATGASAQSEADFVAAFSGEWQIYDESFTEDGQACRLTLRSEGDKDRYKLERASCGGELAEITDWGIADSQMLLFAAGDEPVVILGGTQRRMSGNTRSGAPVILERTGTSGSSDQLQAAYRFSGCYYLGFTNRCAAEADLAKPVATGEEAPARINVIVNLNARAEAREDASVIGVVPANSCVTTSNCVTASDGVWCRAEFGDRAGWLRKLALRQNRWPVVTFVNQCQD